MVEIVGRFPGAEAPQGDRGIVVRTPRPPKGSSLFPMSLLDLDSTSVDAAARRHRAAGRQPSLSAYPAARAVYALTRDEIRSRARTCEPSAPTWRTRRSSRDVTAIARGPARSWRVGFATGLPERRKPTPRRYAVLGIFATAPRLGPASAFTLRVTGVLGPHLPGRTGFGSGSAVCVPAPAGVVVGHSRPRSYVRTVPVQHDTLHSQPTQLIQGHGGRRCCEDHGRNTLSCCSDDPWLAPRSAAWLTQRSAGP